MRAADEHGGGKKEREGVDVFSGLVDYLIPSLNPNLVSKNICALLYNISAQSSYVCIKYTKTMNSQSLSNVHWPQ